MCTKIYECSNHALPTGERSNKRGFDPTCRLCGEATELSQHCLWSCVHAIVPNIRIRPIRWTYANVCICLCMIHHIRLGKIKPFFGFFFSDIQIRHEQKSDTHTHTHTHHTPSLSLSHTHTEKTRLLSLDMYTCTMYIQRHHSHRQKLQLLSLSRV